MFVDVSSVFHSSTDLFSRLFPLTACLIHSVSTSSFYPPSTVLHVPIPLPLPVQLRPDTVSNHGSLQVSRLVILHEEAEDGNAMPDLTHPVGMVSRAVDNLIQVRTLSVTMELPFHDPEFHVARYFP